MKSQCGRSVDILESATCVRGYNDMYSAYLLSGIGQDCISPLCDFHSTSAVNAVYPNKITCYFPSHTLRYRGIRNVAQQRSRDAKAVAKYAGRGKAVFRTSFQ